MNLSQAEEQMISTSKIYRQDSTSRLLTLLLFAVSNNFAGWSSLQTAGLARLLKRQTNTRLLQYILSGSGPGFEAFLENLFLVALESEDALTVDSLLKRGLNPNDLICTFREERYTPIERSSTLHNIEITRLLVQAKADVNKTYDRYYFRPDLGTTGAVVCALRSESPSESPYELVRILLDNGGVISSHQLDILLGDSYHHSLDMLILLADHYAKTKPREKILSRLLNSVVTQLDKEEATKMVKSIWKKVLDGHKSFSPNFSTKFSLILNSAAQRGNVDLVLFLLQSGVKMDRQTLPKAVKSTNKDLIRLLLDNGADIHSLDNDDGTTPLAAALLWGDVEVIDLLGQKGAWSWTDITDSRRNAFSAALRAASEVGQLTLVQRVLDLRPPDTNGADLSEALVAAIVAKQEAVVRTLIDAGADGYKDRDYLKRPLSKALEQKNVNIVWSILEGDVWIRLSDLSDAVLWGECSVVEKLLLMGADPNGDMDRPALVISVENRDAKSMQLLLDAGADINSQEHSWGLQSGAAKTALSAAVKNGDLDLVDHLLSIGAHPEDANALCEAFSWGKPMIEKLLTAFKNRYPLGKARYGCDALNIAIRKGDHLMVDLLLQAGIGVNVPARKYGHLLSPLGVAISRKQTTSLAILQSLLGANGDPNSIVESYEPRYKRTALLAAIEKQDIQKMQQLIDAGADLNRAATGGVKRTPLQKAAEVGSYQMVQSLLDQGAVVNAPPAKCGRATALQLAAIGGYLGIAELLLDRDADVNAPAAKLQGRTALEGAAEHGRIDMLRMLVNAGAVFYGSECARAMQLAKDNGHMATMRYVETLAREMGKSAWDI